GLFAIGRQRQIVDLGADEIDRAAEPRRLDLDAWRLAEGGRARNRGRGRSGRFGFRSWRGRLVGLRHRLALGLARRRLRPFQFGREEKLKAEQDGDREYDREDEVFLLVHGFQAWWVRSRHAGGTGS